MKTRPLAVVCVVAAVAAVAAAAASKDRFYRLLDVSKDASDKVCRLADTHAGAPSAARPRVALFSHVCLCAVSARLRLRT